MIKIGWGTKITILYISFALLIGIMVAMCVNQKIDLVSPDYYQKELVFQTKIDEAKNADALAERISHEITEKNLELFFPKEFSGKMVSGEILFFRPSDASKDYKTTIELNESGQQSIALNNLSKGMYKMQIGWAVDATDYFIEETIVIP
ncbi:MAG: FixH family protein [Bacteroidetes bacterium]|nr:FixH family protein [Bacteroidota bacterium]